MTNKEAFTQGAGDTWYSRNQASGDLGKGDEVTALMFAGTIAKPTSVLEVGCADGWRLKKLAKLCGCQVHGIDPSKAAVAAGCAEGLNLHVGTADALPFPDKAFDVVILGQVLCLVDPSDLFKVVCETDRVLLTGGVLIIDDFMSVRNIKRTFKDTTDSAPIGWYQFNPPGLWLAHPCYKPHAEVAASTNDPQRRAIVVLRKEPVHTAYTRIFVEGELNTG